jgi:3-dehydroquinate synthase
MSQVRVALAERSYDILIESGLLDRAAAVLAPLARGGRLVVVSDQNVWAAQGPRLLAGLGDLRPETIVLPPGEASKSWPVLADLVDRLLALGVERGEPIVAFGGGMIGDLAGFAAAILKRGGPFVQIPTTLLAQVDSSVGGKTGINTGAGKNLVGAFHQPALVLIDPLCLDTLSARELRAGYAEVVKYGLLGDPEFFDWCEANGEALLAGNAAARRYAIEVAVSAKAAIVAEDERETGGLRALLNLGHSFAHALEAETGFGDRLLHGEAVAIGMTLAFRLSVERELCNSTDAFRVARHLHEVNLPASLADAGIEADGKALAGHMVHDKKARDGRLVLVLARGIGRAFLDDSVSPAEIADFLDQE